MTKPSVMYQAERIAVVAVTSAYGCPGPGLFVVGQKVEAIPIRPSLSWRRNVKAGAEDKDRECTSSRHDRGQQRVVAEALLRYGGGYWVP